ncbi:PHD finger protein 21B-like isoform X2 [Zootermopsis nevadensis]|uniref:PHD finger protein 21B-like isoform X2 n=1 Tax=Zootermopsis nevadensis TaxID=136037 RepID=UPI000B8EA3C1|nr:PHD finger protein 21B-like isoform X2 [Zootermopsis nevadensis]
MPVAKFVVLKLRDDPSNTQMKKQLLGMQKHILLLGESQKRLVQQLRKELEANSTNSTLNVKSVALSLGICSNAKSLEKNSCLPVRSSSVSSSSSTASEDLDDSQRVCDEVVPKCCDSTGGDPSLATKLQFMSAVGLVTREVLSELQNRRVERKRRSTANHTQFVYGSLWDVSKRKKNNYLTAGVPPLTRQLTRSLRAESHREEKPPSSSAQESSGGAHHKTASPQTAVSSASGSLSLRIPGLPASLTIERIQTDVCVICRKPGVLQVCSICSAEHHISCAVDGQCPQCSMKRDSSVSNIEEREAQKQRLLRQNTELKLEKDVLEKRAAELSAAITAQTSNRKEMLQSEESTRKSIQRLQDFVTIIKSAHSPPPPS